MRDRRSLSQSDLAVTLNASFHYLPEHSSDLGMYFSNWIRLGRDQLVEVGAWWISRRTQLICHAFKLIVHNHLLSPKKI
jgi:hypothetical protein